MHTHTDYLQTNMSHLDFTSDGTMFVLVSIVDDNIIEDTESFSIVLSNPQPADRVVLGNHTIMVTIADLDLRKAQSYNVLA